jgi:outer membrane protein OmpA-like peptidoglycan-associated protein
MFTRDARFASGDRPMPRTLLFTCAALLGMAGLAQAQPVSGPYVNLQGGANWLQDFEVARPGLFPPGKLGFGPGLAGSGSVGYGFGNGFRVELQGNWRDNHLDRYQAPGAPYNVSGRVENPSGMANFFFDMDSGSPYIYPSFGVGVDRARLLDFSAGQVGDVQNLFASGASNHFAYQGMFGAAFPVPWVTGLSITAEYRYFHVTGDNSYAGEIDGGGTPGGASLPIIGLGQLQTRSDNSQTAMIGLRYALFQPPAPVQVEQAVSAPPPPAAPAPNAPETRTYLVFFDWDRADLSDRARQIVAAAATASTQVTTTRIEVNGYTDLSGTAAYNQALSVRRAKTVEAELVRDGVADGAISIHGFGESNPLVPTAKGVREPQNRRVEIILK